MPIGPPLALLLLCAFAAAAQVRNPESLHQYILDLSAEGQSLADYYQSLSRRSAE